MRFFFFLILFTEVSFAQICDKGIPGLLSIETSYLSENLSGTKKPLKIIGTGFLLKKGGRLYFATTSHTSSGNWSSQLNRFSIFRQNNGEKKRVEARIIGHIIDRSIHDLAIYEIDPNSINLGQVGILFNYVDEIYNLKEKEEAWKKLDNSIWMLNQNIFPEEAKSYNRESVRPRTCFRFSYFGEGDFTITRNKMNNSIFDSWNQYINSYNFQDYKLSKKKRLSNNSRAYAFSNELFDFFKIQPGESGSPLVQHKQIDEGSFRFSGKPSSRFRVVDKLYSLNGITKKYSRAFDISFFGRVESIDSLILEYEKSKESFIDKSPDISWSLLGDSLLYRKFSNGSKEVAQASVNAGNGESGDGGGSGDGINAGNGESGDGGGGPNVESSDRALSNLRAGMIWKKNHVVGFQRKNSSIILYANIFSYYYVNKIGDGSFSPLEKPSFIDLFEKKTGSRELKGNELYILSKRGEINGSIRVIGLGKEKRIKLDLNISESRASFFIHTDGSISNSEGKIIYDQYRPVVEVSVGDFEKIKISLNNLFFTNPENIDENGNLLKNGDPLTTRVQKTFLGGKGFEYSIIWEKI